MCLCNKQKSFFFLLFMFPFCWCFYFIHLREKLLSAAIYNQLRHVQFGDLKVAKLYIVDDNLGSKID